MVEETELAHGAHAHSLSRARSGNMAGVEEAASPGSHLNGDVDLDDKEDGAASTAEEAAKKKKRKKKKAKGPGPGKDRAEGLGGDPGPALLALGPGCALALAPHSGPPMAAAASRHVGPRGGDHSVPRLPLP